MSGNNEALIRLKVAYVITMAAGIFWLLTAINMGWLAFGWGAGQIRYYGPWDYSADRELPDRSYFVPGQVAAVLLLVVSLANLLINTIVYHRLRKTLAAADYHNGGYAPLTMFAVSLLVSILLCSVIPWWLQTYTD